MPELWLYRRIGDLGKRRKCASPLPRHGKVHAIERDLYREIVQIKKERLVRCDAP
jgi:hypothetical protein